MTTTQKGASVGDPSVLYYRMAARWDLIDDILAGTRAMRNLGTERLPRAEGEDLRRYSARLNRTFLHNATADTLRKIAAKPFSRPVQALGDGLSERWLGILDDVDLQGTDLTTFAAGVFYSALRYGLCHVLVDFPRSPGLPSDQRFGKARPYWLRIEAPDLVGWRVEKTIWGEPKLSQIRYVTEEIDPDGEYGEQPVLRCRVWNAPPMNSTGEYVPNARGTWQRYAWRDNDSTVTSITAAKADLRSVHRSRRDALEGGSWELEEEGEHGYQGIPLRTYYTQQTGLMTASPPFEELAVLNWEHWQSSSEQKNGLAYARTPILFESGRKDRVDAAGEARTGDRAAQIAVGAGAFHANPDPDSKLAYVETTGAALGEGWKDLDRIEVRMEKLGMQPLLDRSVQRTATEASSDDEKTMSLAKRWVADLESFLYTCVETTQKWAPSNAGDLYDLPEDFGISVFSDFGVNRRSDGDRAILLESRKNGDLDRRTYLEELQRRDYLSDLVDPEVVEDRLASESLEGSASMPAGPNPFDPDQEDGEEPDDVNDPVEEPEVA